MNARIVSYILIPLIFSNILHMIIVKLKLFEFSALPINKALFGKNKTWRGLWVVSLLNMAFMGCYAVLFAINPMLEGMLKGLMLGLVYVLFELPNSYLKRRLGIASGEHAQKNKRLFMLLDKTDSAIGVTLVAGWLFKFSLVEFLYFLLIAVMVHVAFSLILVSLGIKKSF